MRRAKNIQNAAYLNEIATIALSSDNPSYQTCIKKFEGKLEEHVETRFMSKFKYAVKTKEDLFWVKSFLQGRGIKYVVKKGKIRKTLPVNDGYRQVKICYGEKQKVTFVKCYVIIINAKEWL